VEFSTIREGLNEMQCWIPENLDAPLELPCIFEWERKVDYAILDNFQQAEEKVENELKNLLLICA
jgi:hypothetical protein